MPVIDGTPLSESRSGGTGDDLVRGFDGNDTVDGGGAGYDTMEGGNGNDVVYVDAGDAGYGGAGADSLVATMHDAAVLDGGAGDDTLRAGGSFDLSAATITGIEQFNAFYGVMLTAAQLGAFTRIAGYDSSSTSASVVLTAGGVATVDVLNVLTDYFQLTGSGRVDNITIAPTYLHQVRAYMGEGNDRIVGAQGDDMLYGERGDDQVLGGTGNDSLFGGGGSNMLSGDAGNDYLEIAGPDRAFGGAGNDLFSIRADQPQSLVGGLGDDTLRFDGGADISAAAISGIENLFLFSTVVMTADQLGTFTNVAGHSAGSTTGVIYLSQGGTASVTVLPTLVAFEFHGSSGADIITFAEAASSYLNLFAGGGDDSIQGGAGNDFLRGDAGDDTLRGGGGSDSMDGGIGRNATFGENGNDTLAGLQDDSLFGGAGADLLRVGGNLLAVTDGGLGDDTLSFEGGFDVTGMTIAGIEQTNLSYSMVFMTAAQLGSLGILSGHDTATSYGLVGLTQGGTALGLTFSDSLSDIFTLSGSSGNDIIGFAPGDNTRISASMGAGDDSITAGSANDTLLGGIGNDILLGMALNDSLDGGLGADRLDGGTGFDTLTGGAFDTLLGGGDADLFLINADLLASVNGGAGSDTLQTTGSFDLTGALLTGVENLAAAWDTRMTATQLGSFAGVGANPGATETSITLTEGGTASVQLAAAMSSGFTLHGSSEADLLTFNTGYAGRIAVNGGNGNDSFATGAGNDTLWGDAGNDTLNGAAGNDSIMGGNGNDRILGGLGADSLYGDLGRDIFAFNATTQSLIASPDVIYDFQVPGANLGDIVDVQAIDANVNTAANEAFVFGSAARGGLSLVDNVLGQTEIRLNTDNDAAFEMVIALNDGATAASAYSAADFAL